ncbi:rod shape-determining protein MreC [Alkalitalea saponilacus]|uniref:Cell shape-determining protein MreC n=1 Tax=Alkalitalea saponilacus TaxID=889453 RepID=A0A1T5A572_9BACT|nr:rod shape-determining protein MreC [Alkalitalea saponilacus]ASB48846.1 rod shape-determining protein MreC [Alkalitalea saponilacus]SKB30096.1 rod shape-determining protein MreC [Alkalitalea saponilacus]
MRNFIRFIIRYYFFFLFLLFEVICFYLLVSYNHYHRETFLNSSNKVAASILTVSGSFTEYFSLKRSNEELARENAYLRAMLPENLRDTAAKPLNENERDSVNYIYYPAGVVHNSVNKLQNFITINRGARDGIEPEMGVISARGVVGVVRHVSKNYSTVLSLLNTQVRVSAKLRDSDFFGSIAWDGNSVAHAILSDIPAHASISIGEAVVTSGYSAIFPEGVLLGTIEDFELLPGEGFYRIRVKLSVDFRRLTHVEVIEKITSEERLELEKLTQDD